MLKRIFFSATAFALLTLSANAQLKTTDSLFVQLQKQDSIFFELIFNQCDSLYLENHITYNFKFFHDKSGFQDRAMFLGAVKNNICSNLKVKPIRKLEKGSLVVYPLYKKGVLYGAIQMGKHHFYLREKGKKDRHTSTALFTHVWLLKNNIWMLSEVLSYDH